MRNTGPISSLHGGALSQMAGRIAHGRGASAQRTREAVHAVPRWRWACVRRVQEQAMQNQQTFEKDGNERPVNREQAGLSQRDAQRTDPLTDEVASEGGTPGDMELKRATGPGRGSEATQLWESERVDTDDIHRDDTGRGRRSPVE